MGVASLGMLMGSRVDSRLEEIAFDWDVHVSGQGDALMGENDFEGRSLLPHEMKMLKLTQYPIRKGK